MLERDRTLLFDFDGTLSLGPGPVLAYARAAAGALSGTERDTFVDTVQAAIESHPSGRVPGSGAIDGYDLVRLLSAERGIDPGTLGAAYLASREHLASDLAPIIAPDGLVDFLSRARERAWLVVATNAPEIRFEAALHALGLGDMFDAVYTSVSKPAGLGAVLDEWMPRGELLSIGDVWANDLAPAHARGARTALIGPVGDDATATPDYRAEHLHQLYPVIAGWLDILHPSPTSTTTER